MLKDITIGQYIPGESTVHKLDPRTKLIIAFIYIINIFIANNFISYGIIGLFTIGIICISDIKLSYIYKGVKPVFFLVLITALLNIFLVRGDILLFKWGIVSIYKEGLITAAFMIIRIILLVVGTSLLTLTTSPIELTDGLEILFNPRKKDNSIAHDIAMMMTIALRFIPTLIDETEKIKKAQMARGADLESGGIMKRAKSMIPILVPLFISSFRRADELAMAMESRCYRGGKGRTRMKKLQFQKRDFIAFIVMSIIVVITIISKFYIGGI